MYALANYTHLHPKRTVGNGIASEEYIDGMDSQLGGHVVAPVHRDKILIFCAIFVEKCAWGPTFHIKAIDQNAGNGMQSLAQHCSESSKNDQKIPRRNYITKLICRTPFCRIPSVERSKWDLILFHHHFIIVTSYITVNKNLPQCRLNRQPNAAKTGCPPPLPHGFESVSPQPQSIPLGPFQIFCKNSRRYSKVKVHHPHINETGAKFFHKLILVANLPPVSTIPAANLPPVSTKPVANCHWYQQHRRQICHRCKHQWQTMGTIIKLLTS